jgi:hypothetical protein
MAVDGVPLDSAALPAVLAGPILRRLTRSSICVWVALSRPGPVTLHVRLADNSASEVTTTSEPVQVGLHLWLTAVTAAAPAGSFAAGSLYEYWLSSPSWPSEPNWPGLAFGGRSLPAFPGLPDHLEDLVLMHISCRKWAGGGGDALALAADVIEARISGPGSVPNPRPHVLIHTGDQIYADDVPTPLAPRIRRVATDLVTMDIDEISLFDDLQRIGGRQDACASAGLTSSAARDHLWTRGEFYAAYLLAWSNSLWPAAIPSWQDVQDDIDRRSGLDEAGWNDLVAKLALFRAGLPKISKVLANVPSLMVLDDHEVTDDWNIRDSWAADVYEDALGRRIVANGLLAFNLFQHWGNVPGRFASAGTAESRVLAAAAFSQVVGDADERQQAQAELEVNLGLPTTPLPASPSVLRDITTPGAMRYDLVLGQAEGYPVRILLLDERTAREFPGEDEPAGRISLAALAAMVPQPTSPAPPVTFVGAPSAVFGTHLVEHVLQPASTLVSDGADFTDYESWPAAPANHQELLRRLAAIAPVVVLSGDVHYGAVARASFTIDGVTSHFAQLTCSAAKNTDGMTMTLHQLGDLATQIGVERPRRFAVFASLSQQQRDRLNDIPALPTALPYDDIADVALGRVRRAGAESPAVMSGEVAAAYAFVPDWEYEFGPVDDQRMPAAGPLLTALTSAPAQPAQWDPDKSHAMIKALRAKDLHRLGRVLVGLPQVALVHITVGPLTVHQQLHCHVGEQAGSASRHEVNTKVVLA